MRRSTQSTVVPWRHLEVDTEVEVVVEVTGPGAVVAVVQEEEEERGL